MDVFYSNSLQVRKLGKPYHCSTCHAQTETVHRWQNRCLFSVDDEGAGGVYLEMLLLTEQKRCSVNLSQTVTVSDPSIGAGGAEPLLINNVNYYLLSLLCVILFCVYSVNISIILVILSGI